MTRVELNIRRLVVHGRERFDAEAFNDALRLELGVGLREGANVASRNQDRDIAPMRPNQPGRAPEADAARTLAERLFR